MFVLKTLKTFNWMQVESASPKRVRFRSNLLGGFGAGFITPVNTINFATVFDNLGEKLIENVAVWTTILAFIIIYIPFAVLSRHLDKKDASKVNLAIYCCYYFYYQVCNNNDAIDYHAVGSAWQIDQVVGKITNNKFILGKRRV